MSEISKLNECFSICDRASASDPASATWNRRRSNNFVNVMRVASWSSTSKT